MNDKAYKYETSECECVLRPALELGVMAAWLLRSRLACVGVLLFMNTLDLFSVEN